MRRFLILDKNIFYLPPAMRISSMPTRVQASQYGQFFKRFGLLSCGIVFLTGLQFFDPPAAESSRSQLQNSDSLHVAPMSDAVLEEAREGEYRLALGVVGTAGFTGILLLISSSLLFRQLPARQSFVNALHSSRAPPVI